MRRLLIILTLLALSACMPKTLTLVPIETLVAQTMAAMPSTDTPSPTPTETSTPTPTIDPSTSTPAFDLSIPGAYCIPTNTLRTQGLVTKIIDATTIEVVTAVETYRVRYIGLESPKIAPKLEWQAPQAVAASERMVGGKYVVLVQDVTNMDSEGLFLRYVIAGSTFVNHEMIRQGFGRIAPVAPDVSCENSLLSAQVEAQANLAGIWSSTPVPTFTLTLTPTITNTPRPATATSPAPCNCRLGPFTCKNFRTQAQAQSCYNYCKKLGYGPVLPDNNNNGIVCEGLP